MPSPAFKNAGRGLAILSTTWCRASPRPSAAQPTGWALWPNLLGIIINNGVKLPTVRLESLEFGKDTPFHKRATNL